MAPASKLLWLLLCILPGGFVLAPVLYLASRLWMRSVQPALKHLSERREGGTNAPSDSLVIEQPSRAPA